jgi:hypothetical protein
MASANDGPGRGKQVSGGNGGVDPYAEAVEAARRTIDRAGEVARTAAHTGQDALAREAEARPVTMFFAALVAGFILGRAL